MTSQELLPSTDHTENSADAEATEPVVADVPAEPMRFDSTTLDKDLIKALHAKGFETAFPIQQLTLAMGLRGQDIIGQARTGTGKTLGFGLPLLHRIDPSKNHVQALIVAPTRELASQVAEDLQIGQARGLHVTAIYGGVPIDPQFEELKKAHVVVGTPGRLLDHLNRGTLQLGQVTELVLDEADEMLDMGFLPDVERLISSCPAEGRHTMLFSATMATAIVSLARRYMKQPSFMHAPSDEPQTADLVDQHFFQVHRMDKPRVLARIMQQPGREGCYVFSRTKAMCDRLVTELEDLGVSAIAIHGDLRQATREKNLDTFRSGKASILVATEVAARGLDVDNVTHVVNYDCPDDQKMYLHRIGRTARAGRSGVAVTFAEHNEIEKLNVIRKSVGAFDGDLQPIFSTSPELAEIFDLPEETPWAHLAKRSSGSKRPAAGRDNARDAGKGRGSARNERTERPSRDRNDKPRNERTERTERPSRDRDDKPRNERSERTERTSAPAERSRTRTRTRTAESTPSRDRNDSRSTARTEREDTPAPAPAPRKRARARAAAPQEQEQERSTSNRENRD
ncbi:MAG: superfamily II DNA/RNA helicase, partial [Glaciecola sp.]